MRVRSPSRNDAVDGLKGLAIISVLLLHALPLRVLTDSFAVFHIWQAVPVLLVLMGYTGALTRVAPARSYATRRLVRLLPPFVVVLLVSLGIALLRGSLVWNPLYLLGLLPATGPGNYFFTLTLTFVVALPVLRRLHDHSPIALLSLAVVLSVASELYFASHPYDAYLHSASLARVLVNVALGMLLVSNDQLMRWLRWSLLVSVPFLFAVSRGHYVPWMAEAWQSQSFLAAAYPAALVFVGLGWRYPRAVRELGKASYHIFLVQILWYEYVAPTVSQLPVHLVLRTAINVAACLVIGVGFAHAEKLVLRRRRHPIESQPKAIGHRNASVAPIARSDWSAEADRDADASAG